MPTASTMSGTITTRPGARVSHTEESVKDPREEGQPEWSWASVELSSHVSSETP